MGLIVRPLMWQNPILRRPGSGALTLQQWATPIASRLRPFRAYTVWPNYTTGYAGLKRHHLLEVSAEQIS